MMADLFLIAALGYYKVQQITSFCDINRDNSDFTRHSSQKR